MGRPARSGDLLGRLAIGLSSRVSLYTKSKLRTQYSVTSNSVTPKAYPPGEKPRPLLAAVKARERRAVFPIRAPHLGNLRNALWPHQSKSEFPFSILNQTRADTGSLQTRSSSAVLSQRAFHPAATERLHLPCGASLDGSNPVLRTYGLSGDGVHPITALNSLVLMTPTGDRLWGVFVFNADLLYAPQDLTWISYSANMKCFGAAMPAGTISSCDSPIISSHCRFDVLIHAEEVGWIVLVLERDEAVVIRAVCGGRASRLDPPGNLCRPFRLRGLASVPRTCSPTRSIWQPSRIRSNRPGSSTRSQPGEDCMRLRWGRFGIARRVRSKM